MAEKNTSEKLFSAEFDQRVLKIKVECILRALWKRSLWVSANNDTFPYWLQRWSVSDFINKNFPTESKKKLFDHFITETVKRFGINQNESLINKLLSPGLTA